jgi:hypothetical protein
MPIAFDRVLRRFCSSCVSTCTALRCGFECFDRRLVELIAARAQALDDAIQLSAQEGGIEHENQSKLFEPDFAVKRPETPWTHIRRHPRESRDG